MRWVDWMQQPVEITETELREAFRRSGLWRSGWSFKRAIECNNVYISLRIYVRDLRKQQEKNGKPVPIQQQLRLENT